MEPLVLVLHPGHVEVLADALTALATECDRDGDPMGIAPLCDDLWNRLDALRGLANAEAKEIVKAMGLGRYKNRPKG